MKQKINIVIAEDQSIVRRSLVALLRNVADINVMADAANGRQVIDILKEKEPDIVLLDLNMPVMNGWEALSIIKMRFSKIKVLVLSNSDSIETIHKTVVNGACGFVSKVDDVENLIYAIRDVYFLGKYHNAAVAEALANYSKKGNSNTEGKIQLSERETQIIKEVCGGLSNNMISKKLLISSSTVDFHKQKIYKKTKCKNILDLFKFALRNNIVSIEPTI